MTTTKADKKTRATKPQTLPATFKVGFLASLDKRTDLSKALRRNYDEIVADIGGAHEVGHVKAALIERFCWLETILQSIEHEMVTGSINRTEAISRWVQAVNSLSGLAKVLGVERKSTGNPWAMLDATPANKGPADVA